MGYVPREKKVQDFRQVLMEQFKPPASVEPLMESFRAWIRRNQLARFDCFKEANWSALVTSVQLGGYKENVTRT